MFITIEGGEGAGKTTLIKKLKNFFEVKGFEVVETREPGGSLLSNHIREWVLNPDLGVAIGKKAELLLFLAARAQHIEELIRPAIKQGKLVICDRFNDSSIVYQGAARSLGVDYVKDLCSLVVEDIKPDLTLYLDVDPEIGLKRAKSRTGEVDRIEREKIDFHQSIREGFLNLAKSESDRIKVIDASQDSDQVFEQAKTVFLNFGEQTLRENK